MRGMTRREREVTDIEEIRTILDRSLIVHVGMVDEEGPYVVPMNYGYTLEDGVLTLYLHGARRGRKIDAMRADPNVFFEMECDLEPFESDVPCKYGIAYASVMGRGRAEIIEDMDEKRRGLALFMKTQTDKDFSFDDRMAEVVSVIKITSRNFTAKRRNPPKKEI